MMLLLEIAGSKICQLSKNDDAALFAQISCLHKNRIKFGALGALSPLTLAALYRHITAVPDTLLLAALEEGRTIGFLAGCRNISSMYRGLLFRRGLTLAAQMICNGDWKIASKAWSVLTYPFSGNTAANTKAPDTNTCRGAELLSTAVSETHEGKGIGRSLFNAFEAVAANKWNQKSLNVATNVTDPNSSAFYLKLGFQKTSQRQLHALIVQEFIKHLD